jgi:hypothetical protein
MEGRSNDERAEPYATMTVNGGWSPDGTNGVVLRLSAGAMTVDANGEPCPGLCLLPWAARRVAYLMLAVAEEMEAKTLGLPGAP